MKVASAPSPALAGVHAFYDSLAADVAFLAGAPVADATLASQVATAIHHEARMLDARAFQAWLGLWDKDAALWIPLKPDAHPARDQSLTLDDHRRLSERVWRMTDKSAWALQPPGQTVRMVGSLEAWPLEAEGEAIVASALSITHERLDVVTRLSARQLHRLRRGPDGWRLTRKILLSPDITAGTPHLGWLM